MITKDKFIEVIDTLKETTDFLDKIYNVHIDLYDTILVESLYKLERIFFETSFSEEVIDTITWWLYEYDYIEPAMWDVDKNVIPMKTAEDLWNYVKDFRI